MKKKVAKKDPPKTVLVLRTVDKDRRAYGGFQWPERGLVEAPDWDPSARCGGGLHGWLRGEGESMDETFNVGRLWQVVEVEESSIVHLSGKVKFPRGNVLLTGSQLEAVQEIQKLYPQAAVIGGSVTAGDSGTATAGDSGTATAGVCGTATAGYGGTATAGVRGTATAGYGGTATAGVRGTATAGDSGTATAGDSGTATAGDSGTATAGDSGTATAGYGGTATAGYGGTATAGVRGTATAGDSGTATAGYGGTATAGVRGTATTGVRGTATAGDNGTLVLRFYDLTANRYRLVVGYVGENGIEAGKKYRLNDAHEFVEVK